MESKPRIGSTASPPDKTTFVTFVGDTVIRIKEFN